MHAKKLLDIGHRALLRFAWRGRNRSPAQGVSAIDERQRGENRLRLAVFKMHTRHSSPLHGIVHARQVVEDERGGMEVFERNRQILRRRCLQPVGRRHQQNHARTDQAAGMVEHVAQRLREARVKRGRQRQAFAESLGKRR